MSVSVYFLLFNRNLKGQNNEDNDNNNTGTCNDGGGMSNDSDNTVGTVDPAFRTNNNR